MSEHEREGELLTPETDNEENKDTGLIVPDNVLPGVLNVVPMPERPFFPAQVQPLILDRSIWEPLLSDLKKDEPLILGTLYCRDHNPATVGIQDLPLVGCVVRVLRLNITDTHFQLMVQGVKRFRVRRWLNHELPLRAEVDYPINAVPKDEDTVRAYSMALISSIKELLPLNPLYGEELKNYLNHFSPNEPSLLADFAAALTSADGEQLQSILETLPLQERFEAVLVMVRKEKEVAKLQNQISKEVNDKVSKHQREFFLKEQLKIIQKELGLEKDDKTAELEEFEARLKNKTLPEAAAKRIREEMKKLSVLETGSSEYGVTRNYLDWATAMPWGVFTKDKLDLKRARKILDKHHDGLDDVKERIIEFLAVARFKGEVSGSIILLVGPPGVGKTSIGRSIAEALGRKFYRFSLGGMRDEAEIKGHRRTYVGAMPGKFIQALKEVEVANPVIMLDEIDKIGASYQGDPASALLETLDPEQNNDFLDHYLDLRVDLSKVLFVCTANQLDTIPGPLLDRMETIRLAGYIAEEKLLIAKKHLWPRLLDRSGIAHDKLRINQAALKRVITDYAREAGVRNLEKLLGRIVRKAAVKLLDSDEDSLRVTKEDVVSYLGQATFSADKLDKGIGVVTGLAWTAMGGATLQIQSSRIHALNRGFQITGQLGDVMKESANIAYSFIMANLASYEASDGFFDQAAIHLHVPAGATPKDGPSAGITMASSLLSLAKAQPPRKGVAMTGELTLTGQVLPVGGIREKVIAARRMGIKELILPKDNEGDYEELKDYLKTGMTVHFAGHYRDVYRVLF